MKKSFITGINGFVGSYLSEYLLRQNHQVAGFTRVGTSNENINEVEKNIKLYTGDLTDFQSIKQAIVDFKPDFIFHLAAQSFVPASLTGPVETYRTNIEGSMNLFEAVLAAGIDPVIQLAGSSEEYGLVYPDEVPIKETNELRPLNPYAVSKITMDYMGFLYFAKNKLKVIRTRAFNHEGPRRGETFVTSAFAKQIALIEKGNQEPAIFVGNLTAKRDYTDVRDIVRAYLLAVEKCIPGEIYNICSGRAWSIKEVLDYLLSLSSKKGIKVKEDPTKIRPVDVPLLQGDCSKFREKTSWKAEIPFEQTLEDTLNYWRGKV